MENGKSMRNRRENGSVVTKDVPPDVIADGNPCRSCGRSQTGIWNIIIKTENEIPNRYKC